MNGLLNSSRARLVLASAGLDALVATTRSNFVYATSANRTLSFATGAQVAALIGGDPVRLLGLVLPRIEAAAVVDGSYAPAESVVLFGGFEFALPANGSAGHGSMPSDVAAVLRDAASVPTFADAVRYVIRTAGLSAARVGWDDRNLTADLAHEFPEACLADARVAWRRLRRVKSDAEVERLRASAALTESIERALITQTTTGTTHAGLRRCFRESAARAGAVPGFWSSGVGANSAVIIESAAETVQPGDLVRFDFGCELDSYWSDTGRSVFVGEAPRADIVRRYEALKAGISAGWELVRPGAVPSRIFDEVVGTVHGSGFPEFARHHVGHSIGIEMYDADFIAPGNEQPLEAGMVINLEVPYYELGWGGLQIEDTAVITDDGPEFLTHCPRDLFTSSKRGAL